MNQTKSSVIEENNMQQAQVNVEINKNSKKKNKKVKNMVETFADVNEANTKNVHSSIQLKTEENMVTNKSDMRNQKKSKGKIVFDEVVTKSTAQCLLMDESHGNNEQIAISITTNENQSINKKKHKKKKRKVEEEMSQSKLNVSKGISANSQTNIPIITDENHLLINKKQKRKTRKFEKETNHVTSNLDVSNEEIPGRSQTDISIISDENLLSSNKKQKKKKRKFEEETNHVTSDLDVSNEEVSGKKKKIQNMTSQSEVEEQVDGDTSEVKKKQSLRSQKREKHLKLLEEKKLRSELNMQQKCLNYLSQWKHDKSSWKFEKLKQVWLLQNLYEEAKLPEEFWDTTVQYFSNAKGKVKEVLLTEALKVIENSAESDQSGVEAKYTRARHLVQNLQE